VDHRLIVYAVPSEPSLGAPVKLERNVTLETHARVKYHSNKVVAVASLPGQIPTVEEWPVLVLFSQQTSANRGTVVIDR
jgi:hypothetical protein